MPSGYCQGTVTTILKPRGYIARFCHGGHTDESQASGRPPLNQLTSSKAQPVFRPRPFQLQAPLNESKPVFAESRLPYINFAALTSSMFFRAKNRHAMKYYLGLFESRNQPNFVVKCLLGSQTAVTKELTFLL